MGSGPFDIVIVAQAGRLEYEAVLFAASLRETDPGFRGRLFIAQPGGPLWPSSPGIGAASRAMLESLGAEILPFENRHFGAAYPYGNKIEALAALPEDRPFVFFDTDTLICGPLESVGFDFARPSASMRREGTWPVPDLYGPGYGDIWRSLYERFGLDYPSSLDMDQPDEYWGRHLYFNAGWFHYRCPRAFGKRFLDYALAIRDDPPDELDGQSLDPWLDQVALPLVIHSFGGGRPGPELAGLDGAVSCHYRNLPLLYARESDAVVALLEKLATDKPLRRVLREYEPVRRMIYQNRGAKVRALFDRAGLPRREQTIRNTIRRAGLWIR